MDMQKMMKEMQKMQSKLGKAQQELEQQNYEAEAGGGMVKVVINGQGRLSSVRLDPKAVDPDDIEALEDLILAAVNSAANKKEEAANQLMGGLTQGMKIPGMNF